jgi:hypothetical protein
MVPAPIGLLPLGVRDNRMKGMEAEFIHGIWAGIS